ncbi:uncharacterized protein LOC129276200 [Lytechinus pictus]|uniref:uncharacterized protein LOC129276200 n=1 Tax=Lytechinus pictus TaxID=7653 RepID=UPI0030B9DB14
MCSTKCDDTSRTILWCAPRAISTAVAKCLSFVEDCEVWFELYSYARAAGVEYKYQTQLDIPMEYLGNEEIFQKVKGMIDILANTPFEADRLPYGSIKHLLEDSTAKHVFAKDMGMAMTEGYREYLPNGYRHTFLIRHPYRALLSYRKMVYNHFSGLGLFEGDAADEKKFDIERDDRFLPSGHFVKELYDFWRYLQDTNIDRNPIVIDADDLLSNPRGVLSGYCHAVSLPYNDSLLTWDGSTEAFTKMVAPGDRLIMDLVHFYGTAVKSTCFLPPKRMPSRDELPPDVIRCSDKVVKYYDEMYDRRLKV